MYYLISGLSWIVSRLPAAMLPKLAAIMGWLAFDVFRVRRQLVLANLTTAFGERLSPQDRVRMGRQAVQNFALTTLEVLSTDGPEIANHCVFKNEEIMRQALADGKGAFVLCAHLGNWEVLAAAVNRFFAPTRVLVKKVGGKGTNRFVEERRDRIGLHIIPRGSPLAAVKTIQKTVRENHIVGFVMDQSRPGEPRLPFFGRPAKTNTALATMALRTGAPVIPTYIRRVSVHRHEVTFLPPVEVVKTDDHDQDVLTNTQRFNELLEKMISAVPEQYFWLHNRWK